MVSLKDCFVFKMLCDPFKDGIYEVKYKNDTYFTIQNISSKATYEVKNGNSNPRVAITLKLNGRLNEAARIASENKKSVHSLEEYATNQIKAEAKKLLKKFQELNIDPLGIGDHARSQTRHFDYKKWDEQFSSIPIDVKVDIQFQQAGIVEQQ